MIETKEITYIKEKIVQLTLDKNKMPANSSKKSGIDYVINILSSDLELKQKKL